MVNFRKPFRVGELRKVCSFTTVSNDARVVLHRGDEQFVINDWEMEPLEDGAIVLHLEIEDDASEEEQ